MNSASILGVAIVLSTDRSLWPDIRTPSKVHFREHLARVRGREPRFLPPVQSKGSKPHAKRNGNRAREQRDRRETL